MVITPIHTIRLASTSDRNYFFRGFARAISLRLLRCLNRFLTHNSSVKGN